MENTGALSASLEDYLEAIFHIVSEKKAARAKDIAKRLRVNNSSVTGALRSLAEKGFINYAPYDVVTLTPKGNELAEDIVRKHEALQDFFVNVLCIDSSEAEEAACKMEHAVSRTILDRLIRFMEFVESCPRGGEDWIKAFWNDCEYARGPYENCENCITQCLKDLKKKKKLLENESEETILKNLNPGQKGKIMKVRRGIKKRMAGMGVVPGSIIEVENVPTGDLIDVKVKGYHLTLRNDEASKITVELYVMK
ncbi:metal-dependent transcriptional regulator [Desulfococcaceae bacterium HSG8]|nr:metal-dependent transcriptional regulator [Desulfococcaceae bacterium HSG8]